MHFKLSFKNVRKSFSDYTLYFLTLTFGVCIFYIFNSIEAQKAMLQISESTLEVMKSITKMMNIVSVFVSIILGFLIVYANNFLIHRRKREFGIYMTLGMSKRKISGILISETFLIGIFSLGAGLLAGIFLSQGLSVVTAKLFEVNMANFTFIFSFTSLLKTILYFSIIFIIAIAASTLTISKYKLIDLINSTKQNEKQRVKNPILTLILFLLSLIFIGTAYWMVLKYGIANFDRKVLIECILGAVGTFFFFASLSGFLLKIIQANKKVYLKGLNMFIVRQINNRINTAFVSMTLICLMLFVTIGIFSTGIGMTSVLNQAFRDAVPFDISMQAEGDSDLTALLSQKGIQLSDYTDRPCQFHLYQYHNQELNLGKVFQKVEVLFPEEDLASIKAKIYPIPLYYMTLSEYNEVLSVQNKPAISLSGHQVALMTQYAWEDADYQQYLEKYIEQGNTITLNGIDYSVYPELITDGIVNDSTDLLTLIVPDELAQKSSIYQSFLCFNCGDNSTQVQDRFLHALIAAQEASGLDLNVISKNEINAMEGGAKAIIAFVGIYVGIVFLITSAAVLALQQLSEAADNKQRYAVLQKIGADDRLLSRTIFKQVALYFFIPLALACVHSIVGIKVANDMIRQAGSLNAGKNILITAIAILFVYGSYFLATYVGNKNIILRNQNGK